MKFPKINAAAVLAVFSLSLISVFATQIAFADPFVVEWSGFQKVSSTHVGPWTIEYELRPAIIGDGEDRTSVVLEVLSNDNFTEIIDGMAEFGDVAAWETVFAIDTMRFSHDRRVRFDPGVFSYVVSYDLPAVQLSYEFDTVNSVTQAVDGSGGEVSVVNGMGIGIALTIPANALLDEQAIGLTPVTSVSGSPTGFSPVVAVRLEPDGQVFASPTRVTFGLPADFRGDDVAVGFFTNGDGNEFYLTPLIGPDGALADNDDSIVSINKSSFSVGGVARIEDSYSGDQGPPISDRGQRAEDLLAEIRNQLLLRQLLDDNATYTPEELQQMVGIFTDWNADLRRRLSLFLGGLDANGVTPASTDELLAIIGERIVLDVRTQQFGVDVADIEGFLSTDELTDSLDEFINASFDNCVTTDEDQIAASENLRLELTILLQQLSIAISDLDDFRCLYRVELSPEFTRLETESDAATVTASIRSFNPISGETGAAVPGASFGFLGGVNFEPTSNVTLGIYNPNGTELSFLVAGSEVGTVTMSGSPGSRMTGTASASAQVLPRFGGEYAVDYSGTQSGCTDPDDNGSSGGQTQVNLGSELTSIFNDTATYVLTGSAGAAAVTLTLVETIGSPTAIVSGEGTYNGSYTEIIEIDGELVQCTYTSDSSGQLNGFVGISDTQVVISLTASNIDSSYTGSPPICGSGSCASTTGEGTLTKSGPP